MTTLMRNGRDRRLGKPVKGHAILERALLVGTRSADHIRASGHCGCIAMEVSPPFENRPDTWLHPNASQIVGFLLAPRAPSIHGPERRLLRDRRTSGIERKADVTGARSKRQIVARRRAHFCVITHTPFQSVSGGWLVRWWQRSMYVVDSLSLGWQASAFSNWPMALMNLPAR